jgi:hypothetical protein
MYSFIRTPKFQPHNQMRFVDQCGCNAGFRLALHPWTGSPRLGSKEIILTREVGR